jgi:hypothetical protein
MKTAFLMAALMLAPLGFADQISVPNTFTNGTTAVATEVNANFSALVDESNAQDLRLVALAGGADMRGEQLEALALASDAQAQTIDAQAQSIDMQAQSIDTLATESTAQGMQLASLASDVVDQDQRLAALESADDVEEQFDHLVCNGGGVWATSPTSLAVCTPRLDPVARINTRYADVVRNGWVPVSVSDSTILFERKVETTESSR